MLIHVNNIKLRRNITKILFCTLKLFFQFRSCSNSLHFHMIKWKIEIRKNIYQLVKDMIFCMKSISIIHLSIDHYIIILVIVNSLLVIINSFNFRILIPIPILIPIDSSIHVNMGLHRTIH